jgi:hypothetical protein
VGAERAGTVCRCRPVTSGVGVSVLEGMFRGLFLRRIRPRTREETVDVGKKTWCRRIAGDVVLPFARA